jgi:hypothetical protein
MVKIQALGVTASIRAWEGETGRAAEIRSDEFMKCEGRTMRVCGMELRKSHGGPLALGDSSR